MSVIASLAIALSLFTGAPAISAPADAVLTYDAPTVSTVSIHEDEPGWDCATMGNKDCGPFTPEDEGEAISAEELAELAAWEASVATAPQEDEPGWVCYEHGNKVCGPLHEGLESEAWERFAPSVLPDYISALGFKATYVGTIDAGAPLLTDSWHTYHPSSIPGVNHVFSIQL